ncbi:hypothetical protein KJA16_00495, partial [Patescibacteria group bacterium]|nr:hypothetical protein [Patescibacteria group bacterium]
NKKIIIIFVALIVIGAVFIFVTDNKNSEEVVKIAQQTKEVQEFLKKYPDANLKVIIGDIFDKIAFVEYIVRTETERLNFFIYIDKTTGEIERMEIAVLNETGLEYSTENILKFLSN